MSFFRFDCRECGAPEGWCSCHSGKVSRKKNKDDGSKKDLKDVNSKEELIHYLQTNCSFLGGPIIELLKNSNQQNNNEPKNVNQKTCELLQMVYEIYSTKDIEELERSIGSISVILKIAESFLNNKKK